MTTQITKQINIRLSQPGQRLLAELAELYGSQTKVIEVAIERLHREEVSEMSEMKHSTDRIARIEPQDGIGKSYDELAKMAQASYWVVPINTDNTAFTKYFQVLDREQDGKVHYGQG